MNPNSVSEEFPSDEADRVIGSGNIRIDQQRICSHEWPGSQHQVTSAKIALALMGRDLKRLEDLPQQFRDRGGGTSANVICSVQSDWWSS